MLCNTCLYIDSIFLRKDEFFYDIRVLIFVSEKIINIFFFEFLEKYIAGADRSEKVFDECRK